MGLHITIKGNYNKNTFDAPYSEFNRLRIEIAKQAYGEYLAKLYGDIWHNFTPEETEKWNAICDKGLDVFLTHSDCDGKLSSKQCKRILEAFKKYNINFDTTPDFVIQGNFNCWVDMLTFCTENNVGMEFH